MINVTDSIKKAYEESTTQYDKIILDGQEYDINNVQYEDDCYLDGNVFGTAIARTLDFEIENIVDLENKEFKYLTGIKTENGIEWIDLGTFITQEVDPNDTTGITKVTAMDYMLKSNIEYVSNLNYESGTVTILQVLQEACQKAGMILGTTDFANAGFIVDSNQFTEGSLIRQVFQAVAQMSGTFAKVRHDDKLYFITPKTTGLKVKDVHKMLVKDLNKLPISKLAGCEFKMKMNDYSELILKRNTHPINLVSLGMSDVEGENVVKRDEESIAEDGENSLVINDNPFAYTEAKRKQLITALFDTVKGFEYTSFEITGQAKPYQETGDEVVVVDKDGTFSYSFLFRFNYKSPNGLESEMSAPSLTKATVNYQNIASSEEQAIKRTELIVDKQNQTITGLITKTDANAEKISKHEQTLDSITDTLKSVETTVETVDNKVDTAQSTADTANQNAQNAQQIANNAVSQITTTTQKVTEIEQTVDGITQSVSNVEEKVETVETKADNAQKSANTANTNATNAQNTANSINDNLTTNYYTKTETNSEINQKADEISSTVSKTYSTKTETTQAKQDAINSANASTDEKLEDYSTTEEMNSAITQKADSITSEVSKTYSTKTETTNAKNQAISSANSSTDTKLQNYTKNTEFGTKIEQNWEHVKYAWNQISQAIQLEGDNGNATMAFLDNNKKFAEMGVNTVDNDRYISFAVPVNYGQNIQDGMAWGIQTPDGKFWPILYVKNFHMANKDAGDFSGELVLQACNLVLEGINSAITCGNVNLTTADALGGIMFEDATTHKNIFTVMPETDAYGYAHLEILDKISFFRNQAGSETLRVGDTSGGTNCTITTDGYLGGEELYIGSRGISCVGNISAHSHIYCNNGVEPFSLAEKKRDIEKYNNKALDEVLNTDIYYYNYKEDEQDIKKRVGAIIGDKYKCSKEIIGTEGKGIDLYSMISVAYKAIQEQQSIIEEQNKTIEKQNKIIEDLLSRVEKLEQKAGEA